MNNNYLVAIWIDLDKVYLQQAYFKYLAQYKIIIIESLANSIFQPSQYSDSLELQSLKK